MAEELKNSEGQKVPSCSFKCRVGDEWKTITTSELFDGKKVVVFALPGAFTPTCSSTHLPRYNELAPVLKANGIDDIVCLSVNDAFVMNAWAQDQQSENVTLIPDGNGDFSKGIGMLVDKSHLGFGPRSWRYSMVVNDGTIEKMFIEPQVDGDPFEVSDADTMLKYLNPEAGDLYATLFTKVGCPHCARAKDLLKNKGYRYEEIVVGQGVTEGGLKNITGRTTVPQVYINNEHVGGADDLASHLG